VYLSKLKAVSYWDRKKIKEVIDEALGSHDKNPIDCFCLRNLLGYWMVLLFDHPTRTTGH
jgi:hypothetical protein